MKKLILTIIFILMISFVFTLGCTEEIDSLDIHIGNISDRTINGTLLILNTEGEEIFNQTFTIDKGQNIEYNDITEKTGKYTLILSLDDGRFEEFDRVYVNEYSHQVGIDIGIDKIDIAQKVE